MVWIWLKLIDWVFAVSLARGASVLAAGGVAGPPCLLKEGLLRRWRGTHEEVRPFRAIASPAHKKIIVSSPMAGGILQVQFRSMDQHSRTTNTFETGSGYLVYCRGVYVGCHLLWRAEQRA